MSFSMETFLHELAELLEEDECDVRPETLLTQLEGWDSVNIMGFISYADRRFSVIPDPEAIIACKTVSDLANLLTPEPQRKSA